MTREHSQAYDLNTDDGLSMAVALADKKNIYDEHQAIWWNTDTPIPQVSRLRKERKFKMALPVVWRTAPDYVLQNLLEAQVNCWHTYSVLEGKDIKAYVISRQFIMDMRKLIPPFTICRDGEVATARRRANMLLSDRPGKVKDTIVSWRDEPADLVFSPIASTNIYARVIWLDPALKDADQEMLDWVVYHEMCTIAAMAYTKGIPKATMLKLLEDRFPNKDAIVERMDVMGWNLQYDTRYYQSRDKKDKTAEAED